MTWQAPAYIVVILPFLLQKGNHLFSDPRNTELGGERREKRKAGEHCDRSQRELYRPPCRSRGPTCSGRGRSLKRPEYSGLFSVLLFVFSLGGHPAPDMPLLLVQIKNLPYLPVQHRIVLPQALGKICWCQVRNKKFWD